MSSKLQPSKLQRPKVLRISKVVEEPNQKTTKPESALNTRGGPGAFANLCLFIPELTPTLEAPLMVSISCGAGFCSETEKWTSTLARKNTPKISLCRPTTNAFGCSLWSNSIQLQSIIRSTTCVNFNIYRCILKWLQKCDLGRCSATGQIFQIFQNSKFA